MGGEALAMPTTYLIARKTGGARLASLGWYWSLPQLARQAADARTRAYIEEMYRKPLLSLTFEQARDIYDWARAQQA
jgi:hypothetical protein